MLIGAKRGPGSRAQHWKRVSQRASGNRRLTVNMPVPRSLGDKETTVEPERVPCFATNELYHTLHLLLSPTLFCSTQDLCRLCRSPHHRVVVDPGDQGIKDGVIVVGIGDDEFEEHGEECGCSDAPKEELQVSGCGDHFFQGVLREGVGRRGRGGRIIRKRQRWELCR